ncbi:MAG TPA: hypothetical protein VFD92_05005 [Candidatus Binatia bacterium]|nr:hypothetical protein [Candidatus Binatia bacterium]
MTRVAVIALAFAMTLSSGIASGSSFMDDVDRGRASVLSAPSGDAATVAGRATLAESAATRDESPAYALGAGLAALSLDLDDKSARRSKADRALLERQVHVVLNAQAAAGIGNRAVCLLSGRSDPRSIEALMRLVDPAWSCGAHHHAD